MSNAKVLGTIAVSLITVAVAVCCFIDINITNKRREQLRTDKLRQDILARFNTADSDVRLELLSSSEWFDDARNDGTLSERLNKLRNTDFSSYKCRTVLTTLQTTTELFDVIIAVGKTPADNKVYFTESTSDHNTWVYFDSLWEIEIKEHQLLTALSLVSPTAHRTLH